MYVEHFHSNHVHLPSTQVRSRNSYEIIGIYTENTTELLTGQIPNQPECKLTANCRFQQERIFIFIGILVENKLCTGLMCPTANQYRFLFYYCVQEE